VADFRFQGTAALALDAKGRITVPARHREPLQALAQGQLTLTKNPGGYLMLFPRPVWEEFREKLLALPQDATRWRRVFLGSAMDVEIDSASRVLVSPELRAAVGLTRDVLMVGMGSHLELWDAERHAAEDAVTAQMPMPESIAEFVF
jgi:MraZ protein